MPLQHTHLISKLIGRILKYKQGSGSFERSNKAVSDINEFILISCIDKRIDPIDLVKVPLGKMYVVRNPGNIIPSHKHHDFGQISSEGGAIELAVKLTGIRDVVVCGHSDCMAMHYLMGEKKCNKPTETQESPLNNWINKFTVDTWKKYHQWTKDRSAPVLFQLTPEPNPLTRAFISSEIKEEDSLSQINTLQQAENIVKFPFLHDIFQDSLNVYTLWEYLGCQKEEQTLHLFDPHEERFMKISDEYSDKLIEDFEE